MLAGFAGLGWSAHASQDLGLWEAVAAIGPGAYAVQRADEMATVAQQLARGFIMDDVSSQLVKTLYRDLLSLHLSRLYDMLPVDDGTSRWMGIEGLPTASGYALTLTAVAPERDSSALGDLAGWLEMAPHTGTFGTGQPFAVDQRLEVGTGATGPADLSAFASGALRGLEHAVATPQGARWLSIAQRSQPHLTEAERPILAAIHAALPRFASLVSSVAVVRSLGRPLPCGSDTCLAYDVDVLLDTKGVARAGYGALANTIRKWENLAQVQGRIRTESGADIVMMTMRTDPAGARLRFVSQNGSLVPIRDGSLALDEKMDLTAVDSPIRIEVRADFRYEGFTLEVRDLMFPGRLVSNAAEASFVGRIDSTPSLELNGSGVLRSSLASFADSALGLGDHGRDFARYVALGTDGSGTPVRLSLDRAGETHVLTQTVNTVLLDNALIRFAFRLVGGRLIPDEEAINEFGQLIEKGIDALIADYREVRPSLAARG